MEKKRNVLIINICARNDLNFTVSRSFIPQKVVKRSMGFKRPLVQIQSLGPNPHQKWCGFFVFSEKYLLLYAKIVTE